MRKLPFAAVLAVATLLTPAAPAQTAPRTYPVSVGVVGSGEILVLVADGSTRPCDSSNNRVLFSARAKAGDQIQAVSTTGSICIDHTYGTFRETQWAGPTLWSAGRRSRYGQSRTDLKGTVSTDVP
jgi:hypothetical protein